MRPIMVLVVTALAAGCATYRLPDSKGGGTARVVADPIVSAGLPVRAILRSIDSRPVDGRYSSAEVPAGRHEFLVDCRVAESGANSRHMIAAELAPGARYRFVATATSRRCESVALEQR